MSINNSGKIIKRRRSEYSWKKTGSLLNSSVTEEERVEYPPGPIDIKPSWNPINRKDKPPYSYATIIGHAILTSPDRRLTLNDIYVWITKTYPFYNNDTQGWQNSIRHNLSLHKSFVKIDRDQCAATNPPRKGCFWTIRPGKEKFFVDNLQKPTHLVRKQHSLSQFVASSKRASSTSSIDNNHIGLLGVTTDVASTTYSETEPVPVSSSSSSSSPVSSSPSYDLFCNLPEASTCYNVYPEHTVELFGDQHDLYYTPSLCDTYSTTSSYTNPEQGYWYTDNNFMLDWALPSAKDTFLQPPISSYFLHHR